MTQARGDAEIRFDRVSKWFGAEGDTETSRAVDGLDLCIARGEMEIGRAHV